AAAGRTGTVGRWEPRRVPADGARRLGDLRLEPRRLGRTASDARDPAQSAPALPESRSPACRDGRTAPPALVSLRSPSASRVPGTCHAGASHVPGTAADTAVSQQYSPHHRTRVPVVAEPGWYADFDRRRARRQHGVTGARR